MSTRQSMLQLRIWSAYLMCQGLAGVVWWSCLVGIPASRDYFKPSDAPDWAILSFWLADLTVFVVGSLLSAALILKASPLAKPVLWFTAGGVCYASLYCVGMSLLTGGVWLASGAMLPAMCATLWISVRYEMRCKP